MNAMCKPTSRSIIGVLTIVLASTLSMNAGAATRPVSAGRVVAPQLTQTYVWYDGDREQTVWLNPQAVAEFNPVKKGVTAARSVDANAKLLPVRRTQQGVRLWQMNNTGDTAIRSLAVSHPAGKYSPVFHDGSSSTNRMRALPGNIIVYLDPSWDAAAVDAWLKTKKLEVVKKLEIGPNIFVIKTGPGLEALDTANNLYKSGEVKAAFPDWWQEIETK
jgi:hypothetical protein